MELGGRKAYVRCHKMIFFPQKIWHLSRKWNIVKAGEFYFMKVEYEKHFKYILTHVYTCACYTHDMKLF